MNEAWIVSLENDRQDQVLGRSAAYQVTGDRIVPIAPHDLHHGLPNWRALPSNHPSESLRYESHALAPLL